MSSQCRQSADDCVDLRSRQTRCQSSTFLRQKLFLVHRVFSSLTQGTGPTNQDILGEGLIALIHAIDCSANAAWLLSPGAAILHIYRGRNFSPPTQRSTCITCSPPATTVSISPVTRATHGLTCPIHGAPAGNRTFCMTLLGLCTTPLPCSLNFQPFHQR